MRILFINRHTGTSTLPLASACLAAMLEENFPGMVDCPILELIPGFSLPETAEKIIAIKPDLIALTLYSWSRNDLLSLSDTLVDTFGSNPPPIIAGGPEVTADPFSIQNHPSISLAVSGEGEEAVREIAEKLLSLPPEKHSEALTGFPSPFSKPVPDNLDTLPSPWDAAALRGRKYQDTVWELTRGCPFNCHFCFESKGSGRVRHKSLRRAEEELKQLQERGTENVFLLDPTFNASPRRAKELLKLFITRAPELRYHMEVRTEFLDEEQAELYAELDCTLQIGLQTAHRDVARKIGRPFSPEKFRENLLPLHEYGVPYGLDLIYGLPGDRFEGFRESLDFALECAPNHLDIFPLSVLPGTRLRETAGRLGLIYRKEAPYTVTGSSTGDKEGFTPEQLTRAETLASAADELYNKGRAVPWFLLCCEILELRPVEIIEAYHNWNTRSSPSTPSRNSEKPDETRRAVNLGRFIHSLAEKSASPQFSDILEDLVVLLTLESALRQGLTISGSLQFTHNPQILSEHLEMGISDVEELSAFVPRQPGSYIPRGGAREGEHSLTFTLLQT